LGFGFSPSGWAAIRKVCDAGSVVRGEMTSAEAQDIANWHQSQIDQLNEQIENLESQLEEKRNALLALMISQDDK
jgi:TolA-binding protein